MVEWPPPIVLLTFWQSSFKKVKSLDRSLCLHSHWLEVMRGVNVGILDLPSFNLKSVAKIQTRKLESLFLKTYFLLVCFLYLWTFPDQPRHTHKASIIGSIRLVLLEVLILGLIWITWSRAIWGIINKNNSTHFMWTWVSRCWSNSYIPCPQGISAAGTGTTWL